MMRELEILRADILHDRRRWLEVLAQWSGAPAAAFPSYLELFREDHGIPTLLYLHQDNSEMALPLMLRTIPRHENLRDCVGPYGYLAAFRRGSIDISQHFWNKVYDWAQEQSVVSIVVRLPLIKVCGSTWPFSRVLAAQNIVRTIHPWPILWRHFEHKVRKNYHKALASGSTFDVSTTHERVETFHAIYQGTMQRNGADSRFDLSLGDIKLLIAELGHRCAIASVSISGQVVSSELVIVDQGTIFSFLGGTDSAYFAQRPGDFLKCELMRWADDNEVKEYVLGGGLTSMDGIFRYKRSFAPDGVVDFYIGEWIINDDAYEACLRVQAFASPDWRPREGYRPMYRG